MKDLLLITPPFTQLNTPYPASAYLKGFLNTKAISSFQMDLGIEVILALFTKNKLNQIFDFALIADSSFSENSARIIALKQAYINTIDEVIAFLQGKNPTLARLICSDNYLPQASRFEQLDELEWAFGNMGMQDKAKHLATLYLEDLSDLIIECVDDNFGFSRYAERLGRSANSFDELYHHLNESPTFIDQIGWEILEARVRSIDPKLICFSVPFPGNLYSAFRCAKSIKKHFPKIQIAMGGGFPNTELRSLSDPRIFEFFDYVSLDDGELPIELLASNVLNSEKQNPNIPLLKRTFHLENDEVIYNNFSLRQDYKQADCGTPDYSDLLLDRYISVIEIANPMHSLWSDGRWNKLTMAHGCYWGKCTFCDVSLDYIKNYEPIAAKLLVDRIETIITQTGEKGFHFVDEAAPPALMREMALELLRRQISITWWTNIRFEKSFTRDLCRLLAESGCIAVSGGLEVASDRLLELIKKGVTVEQVARVTRNFTDSGIMVHSYLMYGYPTQTIQETIDSLEMVRQLFELGIIQSGFWHQFALTAHSPIGLSPSEYGLIPLKTQVEFAENDIEFVDSTGIDHSLFSEGLKKSLFNYMHGIGFEKDLQDWFEFQIPETSIADDYITLCLESEKNNETRLSAKLVWLGALPILDADPQFDFVDLTFHGKTLKLIISMESALANWIMEIFPRLLVIQDQPITFQIFMEEYSKFSDDFTDFWESEEMVELREIGLVML